MTQARIINRATRMAYAQFALWSEGQDAPLPAWEGLDDEDKVAMREVFGTLGGYYTQPNRHLSRRFGDEAAVVLASCFARAYELVRLHHARHIVPSLRTLHG